MQADLERYSTYYSGKLWAMIPAMYRAEDTASLDRNGPLREMVNRIGAQAAVLRRSIDRLWEDQSIETCDDWVIPYIADLLATNLVAGLDARGQRLDVANTIYYRRRKGTLGVLEEIAADITGWQARVVEMFRRMGRFRHGLDPEIGASDGQTYPSALQRAEGLIGAVTHTGIGGFADLRNAHGATLAHGPFDEFFHTADCRRGRGQTGWHNIPRLGVFLWRLKSLATDMTTPVPVQGCPDQYSFDPTGREIPLFAAGVRTRESNFGDRWTSPDEWQLPGPITNGLLAAQALNLYPASLGVYRNAGSAFDLVPFANVTVFPELGRFKAPGIPAPQVFTSYHYGFPSTIGAGPYDRGPQDQHPPQPETSKKGGGALAPAVPTGTITITDSLTYSAGAAVTNIANSVLRSENPGRPLIRLAAGSEWSFTGNAGATLTFDGIFISGGDVVLKGSFDTVTIRCCTLDPGSAGEPPALFRKSVDGRDLTPSRIWVEGSVRRIVVERSVLGPIRTRGGGVLGALAITDSIVQAIPTGGTGTFAAGDIKDPTLVAIRLRDARDPLSLFLQGQLAPADRTALAAYDGKQPPAAPLLAAIVAVLNGVLPSATFFDPARFAGVKLSPALLEFVASNPAGSERIRLDRLLLEAAYPLELADVSVASADVELSIERTTLLGPAFVHHLYASESILNSLVYVEDPQQGCVRFSAWSTGSVLPRQYESVATDPEAPLFTTRVFGQPGYCQLRDGAPAAIAEGARNGSEMGAFSREMNAIKERGLLLKYDEFMPLGLAPVIVHET